MQSNRERYSPLFTGFSVECYRILFSAPTLPKGRLVRPDADTAGLQKTSSGTLVPP